MNQPQKIAGTILVVIGHLLLIAAAILVPVAFAADLVETLPALGIAAVVILVGTLIMMAGDRLVQPRLRTDPALQLPPE
jgi:threonine/homoserine efflux transporter RhtA